MPEEFQLRCKCCQKLFTPNTGRQIYCDVICADKMAHRRARERARLGRNNSPAPSQQTQAPEAFEPLPEHIRRARDQLREEETQAALDAILGRNKDERTPAAEPPPEADITEEEYEKRQQEQKPSTPRGDTLTREQVAQMKRKQEEDRLIALAKAERAQRRRDKEIARGAEIDRTTVQSSDIPNIEQIRKNKNRQGGNPWVEKLKDDDI